MDSLLGPVSCMVAHISEVKMVKQHEHDYFSDFSIPNNRLLKLIHNRELSYKRERTG